MCFAFQSINTIGWTNVVEMPLDAKTELDIRGYL